MTTKKKVEKKGKNIEKIEKQVETMEKVLKITQEEKKRLDLIKNKEDEMREDLKNQLLQQNKFGKQFEDMIEDYIFFFRTKEDLKLDIQLNGIRYKNTGGNGFTTFKANESVLNILKVNAQMLKILQDLDLKAPDEGGEEGDDLLS